MDYSHQYAASFYIHSCMLIYECIVCIVIHARLRANFPTKVKALFSACNGKLHNISTSDFSIRGSYAN